MKGKDFLIPKEPYVFKHQQKIIWDLVFNDTAYNKFFISAFRQIW